MFVGGYNEMVFFAEHPFYQRNTSRICISCFVVFLAITAVLVVLGVAILSGMEPSPEVTG